MSYFLFGSFDSTKEPENFQDLKAYGTERNIYFWFDGEITFYEDIQRMCQEQKSGGTVKFAITSFGQRYNSSDLLFPYDKYSERLAGQSMEDFHECCRENLKLVFDCCEQLIAILEPMQLEIFVVEGYDDAFQRKRCSLDEMQEHLLMQIETTSFMDSCIYEIQNDDMNLQCEAEHFF